MDNTTLDKRVIRYGKYFRSFTWDGETFTAIGRTGITHQYDRQYLVNMFRK